MDVLIFVGLLCFLGTLLAVQNSGRLVDHTGDRSPAFLALEQVGQHTIAIAGGMTSTLIWFLLMY